MALVESRPSPTFPANETKQPRHKSWAVLTLVGVGILAVVAICVAVASSFNTGGSQRGVGTASNPPAVSSADVQPCSSHSLVAETTPTSSSPAQQLSATLLTVSNKGSSACEIRTFPKLQLVNGAGIVIATASPPGQVDVRVHIPPSSGAVATLYWQNWCGAAVWPITLQVVLPDQGGTLSAPFEGPTSSLPSCTSPSQPTSLVATGGLDSGSLFGTGR